MSGPLSFSPPLSSPPLLLFSVWLYSSFLFVGLVSARVLMFCGGVFLLSPACSPLWLLLSALPSFCLVAYFFFLLCCCFCGTTCVRLLVSYYSFSSCVVIIVPLFLLLLIVSLVAWFSYCLFCLIVLCCLRDAFLCGSSPGFPCSFCYCGLDLFFVLVYWFALVW